jgi:exoribonuclease-2
VTDCQPGDLVEIWEGGSIVCAVIIAQEKGRWRIVTETGESMRITASRIAHRAGKASIGSAEAERAAAAHSREAASRAGEVDVPSLWELLVDAGGRHSPESIAALAFGDASAAATSAVIRTLSAEKTFFERKGDEWIARSRSAVDETMRRRRIEADRSRRRDGFLERMRARLDERGGTSIVPAEIEAADRPFLDKLIDLAVHGDESVTRKDAVALLGDLRAAGPLAGMAAFYLLVRLGLFSEDENLEVRRFGLREQFDPSLIEAAARAAARPVGGERREFPGAIILAVDDPETAEVDDGLSCEEGEDGTAVVGIHIADPTVFVGPGDAIDEEALVRAATYYFPERRLNMLPPEISERAASLVEGEERPALSFLLHVGPDGGLRRFEIAPSRIRLSARLSYEEADAAIESGAGPAGGHAETLARLASVSASLRARRVESGAFILRSPEISVKVDGEGGILLKRIGERGASRDLVAEMMIQANAHCAGFCATNGIPAIYRRQPPPESAPEPMEDGPYDPVAMRTARRGLRRGEVGLSPDIHFALGVPAYMQITSPLRRYQDLAAVRQVKAWLAGEPLPYDAEGLSRIAATTEAAERAARQAEAAASRYWILKYLAQRVGEEVDGVIIHVEARRSAIELCESLHVAGIPARPDHVPGLRLRLVIEGARPRLGSIRLRQID